MILPPTQLIKGLAEMLEEWNCSEPNLEEMSLEQLWELESAADHLKDESAKFAKKVEELKWDKTDKPFGNKAPKTITDEQLGEAMSPF